MVSLSEKERAQLLDFWAPYDAHRDDIQRELRDVAAKMPAFAHIVAAMTPEIEAQQNARSRELQQKAIVDGDWASYTEDLHAQGATYAKMGVPFSSWYELIRRFRTALLNAISEHYRENDPKFLSAIIGMDRFVDIAMAGIGDAYLRTKEEIISAQQEAIREISTPVLQIREGMLILPIIGVVDTHRARQLTEELLQAIRRKRARVVVMDITGLPAVDSKVANHFLQTVEAARLMGARVIISGVSPEIAQTLVTIGANLGGVHTVCDLQSAIEESEKFLGIRVVAYSDEAI